MARRSSDLSGSSSIVRFGGNGPLVAHCGGPPKMIERHGDIFDDVRRVQRIIVRCTFDSELQFVGLKFMGRTSRLMEAIVMRPSFGLPNAPVAYTADTSQRPSVKLICVDWQPGSH